NDFNPWITAQAEARGLVLMDSYDWITGHANWQDYYSDGVHLYANYGEGFDVLADGFRDATIAAVPEPASAALLCAGLLLIRGRRWRC
ncbi:MAG: PEP-CTERM sorting domain-containing protein, partial [Planctomycetes bacterium]|nr:PEP-CTERM sorting domain-containing protein [Planctomycetota bacterium]